MDESDDGSEKSNKTWVIVGASIAGVMVLIVTAFLVYLCIRKCRKRAAGLNSEKSTSSTLPVEPLTVATTKVAFQ